MSRKTCKHEYFGRPCPVCTRPQGEAAAPQGLVYDPRLEAEFFRQAGESANHPEIPESSTVKESLTTEPAPADVEAVIDLYWGPGTATERLEIMRAAMAALVSQAEQRARQAGREEGILEVTGRLDELMQCGECEGSGSDSDRPNGQCESCESHGTLSSFPREWLLDLIGEFFSKLTPPTDKE